MTLYAKCYSNFDYDLDLKYLKILLARLSSYISEVDLAVYKDYPNTSQGELIKTIPDIMNKDIKIKDILLNLQELYKYIFEYQFKLKIKDIVYSGYLRRNNFVLSKGYGQYEFDIFGYKEISCFGDLLMYGEKNLKKFIEQWIKEDGKNLRIPIQEAFIASSFGDAETDISKRVWMYYSFDIKKFLKHNTNK